VLFISFRCAGATHFSIAKVLIVGIALFCIGPQLGSLDADRDGTPEVPVIILGSSSGVTLARDSSDNQRPLMVARISSRLPNQFENVEKQFNPLLGPSTLLSFSLLRC